MSPKLDYTYRWPFVKPPNDEYYPIHSAPHSPNEICIEISLGQIATEFQMQMFSCGHVPVLEFRTVVQFHYDASDGAGVVPDSETQQ